MILVDAYNILHAPRAIARFPGELGVEELAGVVSVSRFRRRRTVLICDGGPPPGGLGLSAEPLAEFRFRFEGVEILYAGPGRDADSLIEALIERESAPSRLIIASSDRRLVRAAKRRNASSISADDFVRTIWADAERAARAWRRPSFTAQVPLNRDQVRYWAKLLGVQIDEGSSVESDPHRSTERGAPIQPPPRIKPGAKKPNAISEPDETFVPPFALDPILRAALEEWRGQLTLDDLDMQRWIGNDAPPPRD